ncbi:glycosyltransferase family 2 protein [Quadrisphaera sp. KR29]|uniref:glycosyltransferase family 2 protein n=1 Tax=Quadrisphaera sp. KR29 TaxID=3461391 RepID=UPI0040442BFC
MSGLRVGVCLTTIGRPSVEALLRSAAASDHPVVAVAVADQSAAGLPPLHVPGLDVRVVRSSGGGSAGRNAALALLGEEVDVVAFPNDHSTYPAQALGGVAAAFAADPSLAALAVPLVEHGVPRSPSPPRPELDDWTVWRAIEPATFFRRTAVEAVGGWDESIGTGSAGPYQAGEVTDLLLRLVRAGNAVRWSDAVHVVGEGENRQLAAAEVVRKHRGYGRGTGYVARRHGYPLRWRVRHVLAPLARPLAHHERPLVSVAVGAARSLGRLEGLTGVVLPGGSRGGWVHRERDVLASGGG